MLLIVRNPLKMLENMTIYNLKKWLFRKVHPPAFQKIAPTPPEKLGFDDLFCSNEADFKREILV